jgi:uncharacterized membrane protein
MMSRVLSVAVTLGALFALSGCIQGPAISFQKEVKPILDKHCAECHSKGGEGTEASGYEVSSYEAVMTGTKYGPVVVPGDPLSSSLYRVVSGKVDKSIAMPHGKEPLTPTEIATIEKWIEQGAKNN